MPLGTLLLAGVVSGLFASGCTSDPASSSCRTVLNCKDDALPICDSSSLSCRPCRANSDDVGCRNRNAATPRCGTSGRCVACLVNSDCPAAKPRCGPDSVCTGCLLPADCPSRVCNADRSCAPSSDVLYVDNQNGACVGVHSGAINDPYCTIQEAVNAASATNKALISIVPSARVYDPVSITMVGTAGLRLSSSSATSLVQIRGAASAVSVTPLGSAKVVLSGLDLSSTSGNGVDCSGGAELTVLSSHIHHSANGVVVNGCSLTLDSLRVYKNDFNGLNLSNVSSFAINNMMVWNNGATGIALSSSTGSLRFVTVYGNGGVGLNQAPGISCSVGGNLIENAIVFNNISMQPTLTDRQMVNCMAANVVTNDTQAPGYGGTTKATVDFVNAAGPDPSLYDLHLKDTQANSDCCIDKISQGSGLTDHDIDGNKRPQGPAWDIGASEVR